eukprot:TRINITY_DN5821_c0_g1_i4.p1 TRINITY_DN5821_c0_g1~~TRINITY_DN5821_c0_g1_i4.p1  ORF type:complete len:176 (-),score=32.97 TRINITY_DN5821_c0_g1_i4:64-591(-)
MCIRDRIMEEASKNNFNFDHITIDSLGSLKLLDAFLKEVLRWGTPAVQLLPREAKVTHMLGDIKVLKGTIVNVAVHGIGFSELHFNQPYEFQPERFMEGQNEKLSRSPFAFIPFSAGPRHCIGKYLATIEAKSILLTFLKRFSFKMTNPDYKLRMGIRFLYEPIDPVKIDLVQLR